MSGLFSAPSPVLLRNRSATVPGSSPLFHSIVSAPPWLPVRGGEACKVASRSATASPPKSAFFRRRLTCSVLRRQPTCSVLRRRPTCSVLRRRPTCSVLRPDTGACLCQHTPEFDRERVVVRACGRGRRRGCRHLFPDKADELGLLILDQVVLGDKPHGDRVRTFAVVPPDRHRAAAAPGD